MAQQFLSVNRGQSKPGDVVTSTTTPTADFFLQTLTTNNPTKKDQLIALDLFRDFIASDGIQSGSKGTNLPPL